MGENPSKFQDGWSAGLRPVEQINMDDIDQFLARLNARDTDVIYLGLRGGGVFRLNRSGNMHRELNTNTMVVWRQGH